MRCVVLLGAHVVLVWRSPSYRFAYLLEGNESTAIFSAPFVVRGPQLSMSSTPQQGPGGASSSSSRGPPAATAFTQPRATAGFWGESVGVHYQASPRHGSDLIALATEGAAPDVKFGPSLLGYPRGRFVRVPDMRHRGTLHFEGTLAPPSPGTWEFVYVVV